LPHRSEFVRQQLFGVRRLDFFVGELTINQWLVIGFRIIGLMFKVTTGVIGVKLIRVVDKGLEIMFGIRVGSSGY